MRGQKPILITIYSDGAKLSSFGRQKGHPVIVSLANLDSSIRNGNGHGSAAIVGWMPTVGSSLHARPHSHASYRRQVEPNATEEGKTGWANFKCNVWHRSAEVMFEPVYGPSHTGYTAACGDGDIHKLGPTLACAIMDYQEQ